VFIKSKFHGNFAYFISEITIYGGNKRFFFLRNSFFNTLLTSYLTFRFGFKSDFLVYTYLVIKKLRSLLKPEL
jgi:hypothetical protein